VACRRARGRAGALSRQDAAAFDAVIRRDAPRYLESARLKAARLALHRQIVSDRFNTDATRKAWRAAWNRFFDDFDDTLVDALAHISPEGRQKLTSERRWSLPRL